jgi:inhibitor of KinA sporulation pathway (predicted exonuclease)
METIEVGAVLVEGHSLCKIDEFQRFVRPVRHPKLTAFCTQLTSITQADVDGASTFPVVVASLQEWLRPHAPVTFCSWGDYDRRQLEQDAAFHGLRFPIDAPHVNLKQAFAERQRGRRRLGLGAAITYVGMIFEGAAHRGIDDARNIARLLPFALALHPDAQRGKGC